MTAKKAARRNAAKTLDQIKEVLFMTGSSDEQVLEHIRQLEHYHFYLKELGTAVATDLFNESTVVGRAELLFGDQGPFKAMASGNGRNLRITGGIHGTRELVKGFVQILSEHALAEAEKPKDLFYDAADFMIRNTPSDDAKPQTLGQRLWLLNQSQGMFALMHKHPSISSNGHAVLRFIQNVVEQQVEENKQLTGQIATACLALGLNPSEPNRLPTALSNLTTALRLLKPFTGDLTAATATLKPAERVLPAEPAVMMEPLSAGSHGVFKITQEWYDWFWAIDDLDESLSSKILERQGRMRQAIDKRVIERMTSNKDGWPRNLSLMVNFESEKAMGRPVVLFTAQVNDQVNKNFGPAALQQQF